MALETPKSSHHESRDPRRMRPARPRWLERFAPVLAAVLAIAAHAPDARAQTLPAWAPQAPQYVQCPAPGQPLLRIPEIVSENGKLRGTVLLNDGATRMYLGANDPSQCLLQDIRHLSGWRAVDTQANLPAYPGSVPQGYPGYAQAPGYPGFTPIVPPTALPAGASDPIPGPTLRARVGDIVELSFLNQIGGNASWNTVDRGEKGQGCDQTAKYPGTPPRSDVFPDCFHGSTTGNIHFHGTHTNPATTGDNIFIEVRPSLRDPKTGPVVTQASIKAPFDEFFANCETNLNKDVLSQWPNSWNDLPPTWVATQTDLLKKYDSDPVIVRKLWPADQAQIAVGAWPQYYIGATPYCFRLPAIVPSTHTMDGMRTLVMGQAPGTHWYHAHKHGSTAIDVSNGMAGAFIIEGDYDDALSKFYQPTQPPGAPLWTRTQPVLVVNQLGVSPNLFVGIPTGPLPFSVNGRTQPVIQMQPGQVQLWRIVNASSRGGVFLSGFQLVNGKSSDATQTFAWKQTAQDGVQFNGDNYERSQNPTLLISAGNRADLLVRAPTAPGTYVLQSVQARSRCETLPATSVPTIPTLPTPSPICSAPPASPLLTVVVTGTPATGNQTQFIPKDELQKAFPAFLADIPDSDVKGTKTVVFQSARNGKGAGPGVQHTIDGHEFSGAIGEVVLLNNIEEWKIVNTTVNGAVQGGNVVKTDPPGVVDHPFHIHINPFQIVEFFDPNEVLPPTPESQGLPRMRYIFDGVPGPGQCLLDINNPETWKPCGPKAGPGRIWWDVFAIPSARAVFLPLQNGAAPTGSVTVPGYFKMRSKFVDYSGQYVIHCHILAHEDRGMMTVVEVVPFNTPYTHH